MYVNSTYNTISVLIIFILLYLTSTKEMKEQEGCGISWRCLASLLDPNSPEVIMAPSHKSGWQTLLSSLDNKTQEIVAWQWFLDKRKACRTDHPEGGRWVRSRERRYKSNCG